MATLLNEMEDDIYDVAKPWFEGEGDPVPLLRESLSGYVKICYRRGPILRAVADAATTDKKLEQSWSKLLTGFEEAIAERIAQQQAAGFISQFPPRPVAVALNRLDAAVAIEKFGRRPRGNPDEVLEALERIWISTLYGAQALEQPVTSPLKRNLKKKPFPRKERK
jgi:hypothetical protein